MEDPGLSRQSKQAQKKVKTEIAADPDCRKMGIVTVLTMESANSQSTPASPNYCVCTNNAVSRKLLSVIKPAGA